jgi:hypothetical protein
VVVAVGAAVTAGATVVCTGEAYGVGVPVAVLVGDAVAVCVGVAVAVCVGACVGACVGDCVGVLVGDCVGAGSAGLVAVATGESAGVGDAPGSSAGAGAPRMAANRAAHAKPVARIRRVTSPAFGTRGGRLEPWQVGS